MTDTATARNYFRKQSLASNRGTWGDPNLNEVLDMVDESLDGYVEIAVTGSDVTLTTTNYSTNEARQRMLKITGTMSANLSVIIPDVEKWYIVWDATTRGGYTLTFKNTSGTGVEPTNGQRQLIMCDASEVYRVEAGNSLSSIDPPTADVDFAGYKITTLGTPTNPSDGATKSYVDAQISAASILPLTSDWGNTTTGTTVQRKRGTAAEVAAYTGSAGEIVVNTTRDSVHVMDGSTAGGAEAALADLSNTTALTTTSVIETRGGEKGNAIGSAGGGTQDIDLNDGRVQSVTVDTSATTFTFSNVAPYDRLTLAVTNGGSQTVNWPASVDWAGGTNPTLTSSGVDILTFVTLDSGTTWYGFVAGLDMQ